MSLFLSLYDFLELIMGELCYLQQIEHEFTLKPDDLTRRQGKIDQYKNYLMKVVGIDFTFGGKEWSEIKKYQKLRNHFAHEGLRLTVKNYKKLTPVIQHHPELHHNLFSKSTSGFTLNMTAEELEELKKFGENKAQQRFAILYDEGFLGHNNQGMDMYGDDIEIKAGFCGAVVETIDSFWTQLIESVQRTHSSAH
jgi:hypothetical protein